MILVNEVKRKHKKPRDLYGKSKDSIRLITPLRKKCILCLNEKSAILDKPDKNLLNKRSEVISPYPHPNKFQLVKLTSSKTPNDV